MYVSMYVCIGMYECMHDGCMMDVFMYVCMYLCMYACMMYV